MDGVNTSNLLGLAVAIATAAAIPVFLPRLPVPGVVLEILLGVLLGPQLLAVIEPAPGVNLLSLLGLSMLFLIAGFEIDPAVVRGRPIRNALMGWCLTAAIAFGAAIWLSNRGFVDAPWLAGLAMTTTAIGVLLPVLRDERLLSPPYGPMILAAGAVGEAMPIVLLSFVLAGHGNSAKEGVALIGYAGAVVAAVILVSRAKHGAIFDLVRRTIATSGQFPIRLSLCVLILLVVLTDKLNIDPVLGAFAAGAVARAALSQEHRAAFTARLDGLGYGFFVPVFFIISGAKLDVSTFLSNPSVLMMVPVFLALMLAARGLPALLIYGADLSFRQRLGLAFHSGTQLPVVVAIVAVALQRGLMPGAEGAALVGAGMCSIVLFPALARRLLRQEAPVPTA